MPIVREIDLMRDTKIGVWMIEEPNQFFEQRLQFEDFEKAALLKMREKRKMEWLASRWLVNHLNGGRVEPVCKKDAYGKPYIPSEKKQISLSHSNIMAAAIISGQRVGIDVQQIESKIQRLSHKFMSPKELETVDKDHEEAYMHVVWGAKESLFKAYGKGAIDFRKHLLIRDFSYKPEGGQTVGIVRKGASAKLFTVYYELVNENYMLVYCHKR